MSGTEVLAIVNRCHFELALVLKFVVKHKPCAATDQPSLYTWDPAVLCCAVLLLRQAPEPLSL